MMVWLVALLLAAGLAVLEWRRPPRRQRVLRAGAVVVAVAALAALARPPMVPGSGTRLDTALLLTPGTSTRQREALRDTLPGAVVVPWPDSAGSLGQLRLRLPELRHLHVAGWGLREGEWAGHEDLLVTFHPGEPPAGFAHITWPATVRLGEVLEITARSATPGTEPVWLQHPDGRVDSLPSPPGADSAIRFVVRPRAEGPATWLLGLGSTSVESLAVMVQPPRPPAVLVLEGAPGFETTFLRRWLAGQGARVVIRTRVSLDQYRTERINAPDVAPGALTAALLEQFDLLLLDGATLAALRPAERAALDLAVRNDGLGVLLRPDSLMRREAGWFPFRLEPVGTGEERAIRPAWPGVDAMPSTPAPALGLAIVPGSAVTPLMHDPVGRIVAATARRGNGVVGTSLVSEPSRWLLEEEPEAFAGYWRALLVALARGPEELWRVASDGPPAVDHALSLALETRDTLPLATVTAPDGTTDTVGLIRDRAEPRRWWGRYWPRMPGWHSATNRAGEPYPFHVSGLRFGPLEAAARTAATRRRAAGTIAAAPAPAPPARRPLPPLLPLLALVTATGILWGVGREGRGDGNEVRSEK